MTPQTDVPLAPFSTMGVGGSARWFVAARTASEVCDALAWADRRRVPRHVLGGGSNVVIADEGFDGLVLRIEISGIETVEAGAMTRYLAGAGESWDAFVATTLHDNCAGLECLSGIPGLVGGTPIQNVGAYGQDVSTTIDRVRAIDRRSHRVVTLTNAECDFGYRSSRFKHNDAERFVVTHVEFALASGGAPTIVYPDVIKHFEDHDRVTPTLRSVREAILNIRRTKGMVIEAGNPANQSCGSFFVNPVVSRTQYADAQARAAAPIPSYVVDEERVKIPAAWLIERAGFAKGTQRGSVGISPYQAQAIVNLGRARAADVVEIASEVKRAVWDTFGISLVPEPVFVGFPLSELTFLRSRAN